MTKPKTTPIYTKGSLYQLSPTDLKTDLNQPRKYFDKAALQDLVNSIKTTGILQPILFRTDDKGNLFIVAGERRLKAAIDAGLKTVPAILVEGNHAEIALMENLLREGLTHIEFSESLGRMMDEHAYTQEQLAGIIGKARSTVSEILSLNGLPEKIRDECRIDPSMPRKALIAIAKKKRPERMLAAYEKLKERMAAQPKQRGPKGKRKDWQEKFAAKYTELTSYVANMNFETMLAVERENLITRINDLKKTADNLIQEITSAKHVHTEEKKVTKKKPDTKSPADKVVKKTVPKAAAKALPKKKTATKPVAKVPPKGKTAAAMKANAK